MRSLLSPSDCLTFALLTALLLSGCGSGETGPQRYRVSGEVTFDGKPVPAGTIDFNTASGPAGGAQIKNGRFDTKSGKGVVGGPHTISIQGFDGNVTEAAAFGTPLFKPFSVQVELPKENSTQKFEVPATAADGLIIANDPA